MPIEVDSKIKVFSQDEFHALAEKVIGIVFGVHNSFGRLLNEDAYQETIRRRCESAGISPARREVEIKVRHNEFEKSYFMDLLFAHGLMVETKTADCLARNHQAQAINYLLLTGMQHGLLVNLRSKRVEKRFVSTALTSSERYRYSIDDKEWIPTGERSQQLRDCFLRLLDDWGAFLQTSLYREALIHILGGPADVLRRVPVYDGEFEIGKHDVCMISEGTVFAITAVKQTDVYMQKHLRRFLVHTQLDCLQWINMDNHNISLRTLLR